MVAREGAEPPSSRSAAAIASSFFLALSAQGCPCSNGRSSLYALLVALRKPADDAVAVALEVAELEHLVDARADGVRIIIALGDLENPAHGKHLVGARRLATVLERLLDTLSRSIDLLSASRAIAS